MNDSPKTYRCRAPGCELTFPSASAVRAHRVGYHPAEIETRLEDPSAGALKRVRAYAFSLLKDRELPPAERELAATVGVRILELIEGME